MFGDYFYRFTGFARQRAVKFMASFVRRRISLAPPPGRWVAPWAPRDPLALPRNRRMRRAEAAQGRNSAAA